MPSRSEIRDLPVGTRFAWRGEVWKIDHSEPSYVEVRAEQFSNRATFYDPATARKSGELSWTITVEPVGLPDPAVQPPPPPLDTGLIGTYDEHGSLVPRENHENAGGAR